MGSLARVGRRPGFDTPPSLREPYLDAPPPRPLRGVYDKDSVLQWQRYHCRNLSRPQVLHPLYDLYTACQRCSCALSYRGICEQKGCHRRATFRWQRGRATIQVGCYNSFYSSPGLAYDTADTVRQPPYPAHVSKQDTGRRGSPVGLRRARHGRTTAKVDSR